MKKVYNYTLKIVCIYILILSIFLVFCFQVDVVNYSNGAQNINKEKILGSVTLSKNHQTNDNDDLIDDGINEVEAASSTGNNNTDKDTTNYESTKKESEIDGNKQVNEVINIVDTSSFEVLQQETVNISHYGHDCYGCKTGLTASGYYVGDGRIYYQDNKFGSVRIVAADTKYPLGSIVRIRYNSIVTLALVLDSGGGIGDGKRFQIDLLAKSESEASKLGIVNNATLEVLRLGY